MPEPGGPAGDVSGVDAVDATGSALPAAGEMPSRPAPFPAEACDAGCVHAPNRAAAIRMVADKPVKRRARATSSRVSATPNAMKPLELSFLRTVVPDAGGILDGGDPVDKPV